MASISNSVVASDSVQVDGRRWIHERFTDSVGVAYDQWYLCASGFDATAQLTTNATNLLASLSGGEIGQNVSSVTTLGSLASPTFVYSTVAANVAALRAAYANSMTVTLSAPQPQLVGYIYVTVKAAKASTTFYIDPLIVLS